jgi:hypothetical protein
MFRTPQHSSIQVIDAALEAAKIIKRTTENVSLLDPLKVSANTLVAILECTKVIVSIFHWIHGVDVLTRM